MNINYSRLLKNTLSTTSIIALSSVFLNNALAINRTTQNTTSNISTAGDWSPNGFNTGDSIIFGGNHSVNAVGLGGFNITYVNSALASITAGISINNSNLYIGGVIGSSGIKLIMDTGGQATLATLDVAAPANDYSSLNVVDFNAVVGSNLTINNTALIILPTKFLSTGANAGTVIIDNNNSVTFNGSFSSIDNNMLEGITINSGSTGIFNSNVSVSSIITIANGIAEFGPNVNITAADITEQNISGTGAIIFQGNAAANSRIGNNIKIDHVDIGNGEVDFRREIFNTNNINFNNANSSLKLSGGSFANILIHGNFNNNSGSDGTGVIRIAKSADLDGSLGANGASFSNFNFEVNEKFRIFNNQIYVKTITTNNDGQGSLIIKSNNDKDINFDIGSSTKKLNIVAPTTNFIEGSFGASTKTTLKSGYHIYANEFKLYAEEDIYGAPLDSSIFIMEDNSFIDAPITTIPPYVGPPEFSGNFGVTYSEVDILENATILQNIGTASNRISYIKFLGSSGSVVNLSGDLYGDNISLAQPNIILGRDLIFSGQTVGDSTTISLGNNSLSFETPSGTIFTGNNVVNFTVDDSKHGHFVVLSGNLDLNNASSTTMNLTLTDVAAILPPAGPTGQSYTIFGDVNTTIENPATIEIFDNANVTFNIAKQNPFVTWSYNNGVVKRVKLPQDQIDAIIRDSVTNTGGSNTAAENAARLADPDNVGDAAALFQNLTSIIINGQDLIQSLNALQPVIVEASEQISEAVDTALSTIGSRIKSSVIRAFSTAKADETSGLSAGDDDYKYGVWGSSFWGTVTQKSRGESPGFKSRTVGYIIGADTKIAEDKTLGIAFSYADNNVKHQDANSGDTSKVKAYTFSAYGVAELNDRWFIQAIGSFSRNKIANREQRFFQGITEIAKGDFYTNAYGLNMLLGHNKLITNQLLMITTMGGEYLLLGNSKYQERGTTNQNLTVRKEPDHKLNAVIGTSLSYDANFSGHRITPELHGNISYDLLNRSPKVKVFLDGLSANTLEKKTAEATRTFYNLGTSISMVKGSAEISAGYDLYLGEKYIANQGTLKVRLNF